MNGQDHHDEAERLLMVGAGNPLDLWAALTHALLALVATEETSSDAIAVALAHLPSDDEDHERYPHPGGLS